MAVAGGGSSSARAAEQLFANLDRHAIGDASRRRGGVAAAAEALRHLAQVETLDTGPEDQIDVGRLDEHHDSDRKLEGLDPAVDDVGRLFVVLIDLDHGEGDGDVVDGESLRSLRRCG